MQGCGFGATQGTVTSSSPTRASTGALQGNSDSLHGRLLERHRGDLHRPHAGRHRRRMARLPRHRPRRDRGERHRPGLRQRGPAHHPRPRTPRTTTTTSAPLPTPTRSAPTTTATATATQQTPSPSRHHPRRPGHRCGRDLHLAHRPAVHRGQHPGRRPNHAGLQASRARRSWASWAPPPTAGPQPRSRSPTPTAHPPPRPSPSTTGPADRAGRKRSGRHHAVPQQHLRQLPGDHDVRVLDHRAAGRNARRWRRSPSRTSPRSVGQQHHRDARVRGGRGVGVRSLSM